MQTRTPPNMPPPRRRRHRRLSGTVITRFIRHPIRSRLVALILAITAGVVTATVVARAESATTSYGSTRAVFVARNRLEPGHEVNSGDVEGRELPVAVIPDGTAADPVGQVVLDTVHPGEPLLNDHLAPDGLRGPSALIQPGHHGLAIPLDVTTPPVNVGDRIDLLDGQATSPVATDVTVIDVAETTITVAVADKFVTAVAQALINGAIVIALAGPG